MCDTVRSLQMIDINENSTVPIYKQIYDELVKLIVKKVLREGDKLPSVRELALMVKINPNTIQKAYKALEHDNYIEAQKGKGNFVSPYEDVIMRYKNGVVSELRDNIQALFVIGQSKEEILVCVNEMMEDIQ